MKTASRYRIPSLVVVALVTVLGGCAHRTALPQLGAEQADKFLFDRGTENLKSKKWIKAREYFRQIVDNYPQSPFRPDAKLGVGDTYLGEATTEALVLAINEYREFLTFYPTHRRADYAQFKLALCHFEQMSGAERDQTQTRDAIKEFETFAERYPNSSLMPEVRSKLRQARDRLDESDFRVGLFYFRVKWYPGAIDRFKAVLNSDASYTHRDQVYYYLAESLLKVNRKAEALPYYVQLVNEFEQSEFLARARQRIDQLKTTAENAKG